MALERCRQIFVPRAGSHAWPIHKIREIQECVTIPVMAKARIGHFVEAQILESLEVDYIDEAKCLHRPTRQSHQQVEVQGAIRLRRRQSGRGLRRISEGPP